jgi:hypothetical protein
MIIEKLIEARRITPRCSGRHRVGKIWTSDSKMCTFSLRVCRVWCAQCNFDEMAVTQVRVEELDLKLRGGSLVSLFSPKQRSLGITDSCESSTAYGAKVTAHYNTNAASLDGLIGEFGVDKIQKVQADLGAEGDTIRMFHEIDKERFGPVQVIIVNHATYVAEDVLLSRMSLEQWDRTINANLTSSFLVIREYLNGLESLGEDAMDVKNKAAIILVGSTAGKYGEAGHADYSVTKSGRLFSSVDLKGS